MADINSPESLLVLWDIDGTLLSPVGGVNEDYELALGAVHPGVSLCDVHTHGKTDRQVVEEYLVGSGLDVQDAPLVLEQLDMISHKYLTDAGRLPALDGVDDALARAAAAGHTNALLTGNTPARAINKLTGSGMDTSRISWRESYFGTNAPTRPLLTAAARRRNPERRVVIIGDTPLDGHAAADAGLLFIGVTTGVYAGDTLWDAGAIEVVPDLITGAERLDQALSGLLTAYKTGMGPGPG